MISILVSLVTIFGMWLIARKDWRGWLVGICNQVLWLVLIIQTRAWGLLLLTGTLLYIYTKALISWRRDAKPCDPPEECQTCGGNGNIGTAKRDCPDRWHYGNSGAPFDG